MAELNPSLPLGNRHVVLQTFHPGADLRQLKHVGYRCLEFPACVKLLPGIQRRESKGLEQTHA